MLPFAIVYYQVAALLLLGSSFTNAAMVFDSHCFTISAGELCYGIHVPASGQDDALYLTMSGPSSVGYSGFGFGSGMKDSLYFIATPTQSNVTVSVRTAPGNVMPTAYSATPVTVDMLNGTMNNGSVWTANLKCSNCRSWSTGSIDVNSTAAPLIWASGALSNGAVASDTAASIENHGSMKGTFQLNLVAASANSNGAAAGSRAATTMTTTAAPAKSNNSYKMRLWWSHAVLITVGWILVMGLGAILLRFFPSYFGKPVRVHYLFQIAGTVLIIIGAVLGIVGSSGSHFKHSHQTLGIIVFILLFVQAALGTVQHLMFKKGVQGRLLYMGIIHRYFGRALIVTSMVTAGLAFRLPMVAKSKGVQIAWYVIMGVLVLIYTIANLALPTKQTKIHDEKSPLDDGARADSSSNGSTTA